MRSDVGGLARSASRVHRVVAITFALTTSCALASIAHGQASPYEEPPPDPSPPPPPPPAAYAISVYPDPPAPSTRTLDRALSSDLRSAPSLHPTGGWPLFGGELGFFVGGTLTVAIAIATIPDGGAGGGGGSEGAAALYATGVTVGVVGATIGGILLFKSLARRHRWDPESGWGAAGIFPGMMAGIALAGGTMLAANDDPSAGARTASVSVGALGGGALGYLLFRQMARGRRDVGWQTFAFWCGFFLGEMIGIAASSAPAGGGASADRGQALLFGAAGGGIVSAIIAHLIVRAAE